MKKLVILGAGESGIGAAILGKKEGWDVFVSDMALIKPRFIRELELNKIEFEEGVHSLDIILNSDLVVKSPGIPDTIKLIEELNKRQIEVISEIEFAYRYNKAKLIAITGSNGKTTTTLLTYHILKEAGLNVGLAGNIGNSFAKQVAEENFDYYVLELSSFQLDGIKNFRSEIAILLNITPDHLDRYDYKIENYRDSKLRITMNQLSSDYLIYDADDEGNLEGLKHNKSYAVLVPYSDKAPAEENIIYGKLKEKSIHMSYQNDDLSVTLAELSIQGKHNARNSLAGGLAARLLGVHNETIRKALTGFEAVEHRLEAVRTVEGINFINDSKATNVNAVFHALDSMKKSTVWIVGGVDKGNDYSDLLPFVREKVRAIVCLGLDNEKLLNSFKDEVNVITETFSMEEAVNTAYTLARKGDNVLLSPACASFDLFESYEDRGVQFKNNVNNLLK